MHIGLRQHSATCGTRRIDSQATEEIESVEKLRGYDRIRNDTAENDIYFMQVCVLAAILNVDYVN